MQELIDIVSRHRRQLVDEVTAQVDDALLRADLELLFDDLIEVMESGTSSAMRERLGAIVSRRVVGEFSFADVLRAGYFTITPALRKVVEGEGADFAPLEPILMRATIAAGDAYSAAFQARLVELQEQRISGEAEADRLRAISHLVIDVAHELNTPLDVISQASELAARDGNEDIREAAELIRNNVARASRLIHRFRGLSVSETADAVQPVDVASAVDEAIALYRTSVLEPTLEIEVVDQLGRAERDRQWSGHPLYFTHVLLNLLSNADHHAYRGAGGPVEIVLARREDRLHVTVTDHGIGIPESDVEAVLHPCFTTGGTRGRAGLGMAVVHNLVTAGMHGTLNIDSVVGAGTRMLLDLPWREPSGAP